MMKWDRQSSLLLLALVGVLGCAGGQTQGPPPAEPSASTAQSTQPAEPSPSQRAPRATEQSPDQRPAAAEPSIAISDATGGVDLAFTGPPEQLQSTRARIRALADQHNALVSGATSSTMHCPCAAIFPTGCCGMTGNSGPSANPSASCCGKVGGQGHGMMHCDNGCCDMMGQATVAPVVSNATVRDVEGGAVMSLTPTTPTDIAALRQQVHMCVDHVQRGGCPMMQQ